MTLHDTAAVVTGASRGIGLATARLLADAGARVYGLARSEDDLERISETLGDRFSPVVCDVTDADAVQSAIDGVAEDAGRLDVLVNNAGLGRFGDVDALSLDDWQLQIDTNLSGVFYCTRAAVPHMKRQGEERAKDETAGFIVNVASIAGLIGNPRLSAYNATKHGLRGFSDATMKELRPARDQGELPLPGLRRHALRRRRGDEPEPGRDEPGVDRGDDPPRPRSPARDADLGGRPAADGGAEVAPPRRSNAQQRVILSGGRRPESKDLWRAPGFGQRSRRQQETPSHQRWLRRRFAVLRLVPLAQDDNSVL